MRRLTSINQRFPNFNFYFDHTTLSRKKRVCILSGAFLYQKKVAPLIRKKDDCRLNILASAIVLFGFVFSWKLVQFPDILIIFCNRSVRREESCLCSIYKHLLCPCFTVFVILVNFFFLCCIGLVV